MRREHAELHRSLAVRRQSQEKDEEFCLGGKPIIGLRSISHEIRWRGDSNCGAKTSAILKRTKFGAHFRVGSTNDYEQARQFTSSSQTVDAVVMTSFATCTD